MPYSPTPERLKKLNAPYLVKLHIRERKRGWTFELRWWDGNKNHRLNLNTQNLDTALKARDRSEMKVAVHRRTSTSLTDRISLSEFIERYLYNCQIRQLRPNTIKNARWKLNALLRIIGDEPIETITTKVIQDYISREFDKGRAIRGVWADFRAIRAAFNWAVNEELLHRNLCNKVDFPKIPRQVPKRFTSHEFKRVIEQINRPDDFAIAMTFILTGMRREEVLTLKWSDIDYEAKRIFVEGKGRHEREIPISDLLMETLSSLPHDSNYVFPGYRRKGNGFVPVGRKSASVIRKRFHTYMTAAGVRGRGTFHRFRHSTASALADLGFTELDIGVFLGHANRSVTQGYVHIGSYRLQELASALDSWVRSSFSSDIRPIVYN